MKQDKSYKKIKKICRKWWMYWLDKSKDTSLKRAARARLRHCREPIAALMMEAVQDLGCRIKQKQGTDLCAQPHKLYAMAVALAHIETDSTDSKDSAAKAFGREQGDRKLLSANRFENLMRTRKLEELVLPLTRALRMIKGAANPGELGADIFYWGERTQARWCFDYYRAERPRALEPETTKETQP